MCDFFSPYAPQITHNFTKSYKQKKEPQHSFSGKCSSSLQKLNYMRLFLFFLFFLFSFFEDFNIRERNVAFDLAVIQMVNGTGFKVMEKFAQVNDTAGNKPDGGNNTADNRHANADDEEVISPPFLRPRIKNVPNQNKDESNEEVPDNGVEEYTPADNFIPECEFRSDTEQRQKTSASTCQSTTSTELADLHARKK